jgi:hypothetical protein
MDHGYQQTVQGSRDQRRLIGEFNDLVCMEKRVTKTKFRGLGIRTGSARQAFSVRFPGHRNPGLIDEIEVLLRVAARTLSSRF